MGHLRPITLMHCKRVSHPTFCSWRKGALRWPDVAFAQVHILQNRPTTASFWRESLSQTSGACT